jgi:hypothetical protein
MALVRGICVDGPCRGEMRLLEKSDSPYSFATPLGSTARYQLTDTPLPTYDTQAYPAFALEIMRTKP